MMKNLNKPNFCSDVLVEQLFTQTHKNAVNKIDQLLNGLSTLNEKDFYLVLDFLIEKKILREVYGAFLIFEKDYLLLKKIETKQLWRLNND
jgi:hypothetical protein